MLPAHHCRRTACAFLVLCVVNSAAVRRLDGELDSVQMPEGSPSWAMGILAYVVLLQCVSQGWTYFRESGKTNQIQALKARIRSAEKQAKALNMPDTIVESFKYEREALKLTKQVDAIGAEIRTSASTPVSRCFAFSMTYVFPVLPVAWWGNACLFCLGDDGFLWPGAWLLSPSGEVCGKGCVGLIPWSFLCTSAARYTLVFIGTFLS
eukprot:TRINITY_DN15740_c0_g2_i3.p1 TRINITY_DN15740_c0_g2~~TRINITY_DN15740_c0_g2_i3.p1  ORF type:complete len:208 (-),score=26.64 TRINITY_DN15740_c0_g2_i3:355-978(-)